MRRGVAPSKTKSPRKHQTLSTPSPSIAGRLAAIVVAHPDDSKRGRDQWHACFPIPRSTHRPGWPARRRRRHLAYVALLDEGQNGKKDALGVVDTDPTSPGLRATRRQAGFPERRQRAPPLRVECLQLASLRIRAQPAHGTAIPRGAGDEQLAHPRHRYGARSAQPAPHQGHRR